MDKIQQNKVEIENLKFEAEKAEREGDYGKVAEIRYGKLQALDKEIEDTQKQLRDMQGDKAMIKEEVDAEDIADVVSRWTGIPVSKMLQSEKDKLLHLALKDFSCSLSSASSLPMISSFGLSFSRLIASRSISSCLILREISSSSSGTESTSIRSLAAASSIRSMALSGRTRLR